MTTKAISKGRPGRKPKNITDPEVDRVNIYRDNHDGTYTKIEGGIDLGQGLPAASPTLTPTPLPELPNPAIAALQEDIIQLVKQRSAARGEISNAMLSLNQANARLTAAKDYLMGLEQEVSYRMQLVSQMRGDDPIIQYSAFAGPQPWTYTSSEPTMNIQFDNPRDIPNGHGVSIPDGVSSIPAPRNVTTMPGVRGVRSESAAAERNAEISTRAAI